MLDNGNNDDDMCWFLVGYSVGRYSGGKDHRLTLGDVVAYVIAAICLLVTIAIYLWQT